MFQPFEIFSEKIPKKFAKNANVFLEVGDTRNGSYSRSREHKIGFSCGAQLCELTSLLLVKTAKVAGRVASNLVGGCTGNVSSHLFDANSQKR